jgi:hypothetical protein
VNRQPGTISRRELFRALAGHRTGAPGLRLVLTQAFLSPYLPFEVRFPCRWVRVVDGTVSFHALRCRSCLRGCGRTPLGSPCPGRFPPSPRELQMGRGGRGLVQDRRRARPGPWKARTLPAHYSSIPRRQRAARETPFCYTRPGTSEERPYLLEPYHAETSPLPSLPTGSGRPSPPRKGGSRENREPGSVGQASALLLFPRRLNRRDCQARGGQPPESRRCFSSYKRKDRRAGRSSAV